MSKSCLIAGAINSARTCCRFFTLWNPIKDLLGVDQGLEPAYLGSGGFARACVPLMVCCGP